MKIFTFILDLILSLVSASYPAANRAEEKLVTPTYIHSSSVLNYDFEVLCGFLLHVTDPVSGAADTDLILLWFVGCGALSCAKYLQLAHFLMKLSHRPDLAPDPGSHELNFIELNFFDLHDISFHVCSITQAGPH